MNRANKGDILLMEKQNNPSLSTVIIDIKHPLQPEWVITTDDVHKFLKELDEKKPQMEDERDNYPPYMCSIAVDENGKERLTINYSRWYGDYDPFPINGKPRLVTHPMGESGIS